MTIRQRWREFTARRESPERHGLERLYAIQAEERDERRGLETRASATIAAALVTLAFAGNAAADGLPTASLSEAILLGIGAGLILLSIVVSTFGLMGGNFVIVRSYASLLKRLHLNRVDFFLGPISVEVFSAKGAAEFLAPSGKQHWFSGPSVRALVRLDPKDEPEHVQLKTADESLLEPGDLQVAIEAAHAEAKALKASNSALVAVLRLTSGVTAVGVVALVLGLALLLGSHAIDAPSTGTGTTPAPAP